MLYKDLPKTMYNYQWGAKNTTGKSPPFFGMVKDTELGYNFKTDLGTGGADDVAEKLGATKLGSIMDTVAKWTFGGGSATSEMFTIKKIKEFSNPTFSINSVFYAGLKTRYGTINSFKEFMQDVSHTMLPGQTLQGPVAILSTNQTDWKKYLDLLTNFSRKDDKVGYSLTIGAFLHIPTGLFITGIDVKQPMVFDEKGTPMVWEATFSFEYYKQVTSDEMKLWFK